MMNQMKLWAGMLLTVSFACGCSDAPAAAGRTAERAAATPDTAYILTERPAGEQSVIDARLSSKDGEEITVVGVIGGSTEPFVDGLAAFTIVDCSAAATGESHEGCTEACCNPGAANIATVKIVNERGRMIGKDARELLAVEKAATVVLRGKAKRDEGGNLTVLAEKVHVVRQ